MDDESGRQSLDASGSAQEWMRWNLGVAVGLMMVGVPGSLLLIACAAVADSGPRILGRLVLAVAVAWISYYATGISTCAFRYVTAWVASRGDLGGRPAAHMALRTSDVVLQLAVSVAAAAIALWTSGA